MTKMTNSTNRNTVFGATMIALVLCTAGIGHAASSDIVAAPRVNTNPISDADVVLGDIAIQDVLQSDVFQRLMDDPELLEILADPAYSKMQSQPVSRVSAPTPRNIKMTKVLDDPNLFFAVVNRTSGTFRYIKMESGMSIPPIVRRGESRDPISH